MKDNIEESLLLAGERLDDLLIDDLKIIQREAEFCFSLDAVLLAHFATIKKGCTAIDLGTGTGVIALLLSALGAKKITGIELNQSMAEMAMRSVRLNKLTEQVTITHADLRQLQGILPSGECELVVSNPPYRVVGGGFLSLAQGVAMARHELTANLQDVIAAAKYLVKYRGRFAMVHLPERMVEIVSRMSAAGIEPKRLRLVHGHADKKPNMLLVEGVRGARPGLEVLPPLIVYAKDGSYSKEVKGYYENK
ncbi:MAG: methyltransferase [Pelosinus sp.]|nr:methyltransferase [Pelosinus sp.]